MKIIFHLSPLLLLPILFNSVVRGTNVRTSNGRKLQDEPCIQCHELDVPFHILERSDRSSDASQWTNTHITLEVDNLNARMVGTPFKFKLRTITNTLDDAKNVGDGTWKGFATVVADELRVGGRTSLNVFVNDGFVCGFGGVANQEFQDVPRR